MILVLGCDHCLQYPERTDAIWQAVEELLELNSSERIRSLIEKTISEYGCEFVGEETNEDQVTPAASITRNLQALRKNDGIRKYRNDIGDPKISRNSDRGL